MRPIIANRERIIIAENRDRAFFYLTGEDSARDIFLEVPEIKESIKSYRASYYNSKKPLEPKDVTEQKAYEIACWGLRKAFYEERYTKYLELLGQFDIPEGRSKKILDRDEDLFWDLKDDDAFDDFLREKNNEFGGAFSKRTSDIPPMVKLPENIKSPIRFDENFWHDLSRLIGSKLLSGWNSGGNKLLDSLQGDCKLLKKELRPLCEQRLKKLSINVGDETDEAVKEMVDLVVERCKNKIDHFASLRGEGAIHSYLRTTIKNLFFRATYIHITEEFHTSDKDHPMAYAHLELKIYEGEFKEEWYASPTDTNNKPIKGDSLRDVFVTQVINLYNPEAPNAKFNNVDKYNRKIEEAITVYLNNHNVTKWLYAPKVTFGVQREHWAHQEKEYRDSEGLKELLRFSLTMNQASSHTDKESEGYDEILSEELVRESGYDLLDAQKSEAAWKKFERILDRHLTPSERELFNKKIAGFEYQSIGREFRDRKWIDPSTPDEKLKSKIDKLSQNLTIKLRNIIRRMEPVIEQRDWLVLWHTAVLGETPLDVGNYLLSQNYLETKELKLRGISLHSPEGQKKLESWAEEQYTKNANRFIPNELNLVTDLKSWQKELLRRYVQKEPPASIGKELLNKGYIPQNVIKDFSPDSEQGKERLENWVNKQYKAIKIIPDSVRALRYKDDSFETEEINYIIERTAKTI